MLFQSLKITGFFASPDKFGWKATEMTDAFVAAILSTQFGSDKACGDDFVEERPHYGKTR